MEKDKPNTEETKLGVWGDNTFGQLALDNSNLENFVFIPKLITFEIHITEISCGFQHSLFRSVEGEIFTTGNNSKGQLGIGKKIKRRTSPTSISLEDPKEKTLLAAAQGYHNIIYTEYGNVYAWGDNEYGQLGTSDFKERDLPFNINKNLNLKTNNSIIQISLGHFHSAVLLNNGKVYSWGSNNFYQLAIDVDSKQEINQPIQCDVVNIKKIACGQDQILFLDKNGDVLVTGNNEDGKLNPQNKNENIKQPEMIEIPERVKKIFANTVNALITEKDDLYIWGSFLGEVVEMHNPFADEDHDGSMNTKKDPQVTSNLSSKYQGNRSQLKIRIDTVGLGSDFIVAADDYGECYSWGNNDQGQLGQVIDENQSGVVPYENHPKKLLIFQPFDVKSIHIGNNFSLLLLAEKAKDNYEGTSVDYMPYNIQLKEARDDEEDQGMNYVEEEEEEGEEDIQGYPIDENSYHEEKKENPRTLFGKDKSSELMYQIFRMLVYLYEDLRYKLIKIIDDNVDVDKVLEPEFVEMIKKQQDIIDEYLNLFDLKLNLPFDVNPNNIGKFKFKEQNKFGEKYFKISKEELDALRKNKSMEESEHKRLANKKILERLKIEKDILTQRLSELKEYLD